MWDRTDAADQDWFLNSLLSAIREKSSKSITRALLHAYIRFFDSSRPSFRLVADFLSRHALRPNTRLAEKWLAINDKTSLFDVARGPMRIAKAVLDAEDAKHGFSELGFVEDQIDGSLARAAFVRAYQLLTEELATAKTEVATKRRVRLLFNWVTGAAGEFRYQNEFAPMATSLLEALISSNISVETKEEIVRFLVDQMGDPRLNRSKWRDVSEAAFEMAMRMLVRATLDDFTRVIDATADARHWNERKPFWMQYYEMGAITDAWVAFGPKAILRAQSLEKRYGKLLNASEKTHSALILKIGEVVIVEWSHNGRCRFFARNRDWAPALYASRYDFVELHSRSNHANGFLSHMENWQRRFAYKIFRMTNIRHPKFGSGSQF